MNQKTAAQVLAAMPEVRLKAGIRQVSLPPKKHPKSLPADAGEAPKRVEKVARAKP